MGEKYLKTFDGNSIYYRIEKKKNPKANLVFIHGISGNWTGWKSVINELAKENYSILISDLRAHGKSTKSAKIKIDYCSKDLSLILKKERMDDIILLGHCFGGLIALDFYSKFPNKVKKLIMVSSTYTTPLQHKKILRFFNLPAYWISKILHWLDIPVRRNFAYRDCSKYKNRSLLYVFLSDLAGNPKRTYFNALAEYFKKRDKDILKKINIPVLFITGDKDIYVNYTASKFMHEKVKNSKLHVIKDADHIPIIRYPKMISRIILDFL